MSVMVPLRPVGAARRPSPGLGGVMVGLLTSTACSRSAFFRGGELPEGETASLSLFLASGVGVRVDGFSISDLWLPPINLRWTGETPNPGRFHFPKLETMILGIQKNFLGKIELNLATLSPKVFRNV